jgi:RNA polymerase sigma-70 factor, ECF subfamily
MNDRVEQIKEQCDKQMAEHICRKVNHDDCCHDILQEVYVKIIQHIDKIDKADKIGPYIKKLASNTVIDHHGRCESYNATSILFIKKTKFFT